MDKQDKGKVVSNQPESRINQFTVLAGMQKHFSPLRFLIITIGGIFLAEVIAMIVVYRYQSLPYYLLTLIDASIMIVMIFPLVYFLSLKPLIHHIDKHQRTEAALRKSEERFAVAFRSSPAALSITRLADGTFLDANESFLHLFGYNREEVIGHTSIELGLFRNSEERAGLIPPTFPHIDVRDYEMTARIKSGELRNVLISTQGIELGGEACILATGYDITESKRAKARLQRVNRALSVLNECNQVLVRAEDETKFLQRMCEILVSIGEYRMAWVGYAQHDQARSVRPAAQFGFEDGYLDSAQITWSNDERRRGPTGTAIREGVTQVNQNFLTNPKMAPWRESALLRGYQSSIALPLQDENSTFGALTIYSVSPDAFDEDEVHLLQELANDLAFGITALRVRAERNRAQELVREMALFPALNPDAVLRVDSTGQVNMANQAAEQMGLCVGAQVDEILPDFRDLDFAICIAAGTTQQIPEMKLGKHYLHWTIRGVPERGLAFLYSTDITERKQAEDKNRQLSRIVKQTEDTVVVTNRDGVIEYVNPAFERLTGYAKEEVLGKTPRVLKSGVHDSEFYRNLWNSILQGDVFQSEIANCKKNGELIYEVKTITPLRDAQGNITQFVATGKDITQHKLDEDKLRRAYDELELRVHDRTEELRIAISELEDEINVRQRAEEELKRFNRAMVGRELRMMELKKEVNVLCTSAGQPARYSLDFEKETP